MKEIVDEFQCHDPFTEPDDGRDPRDFTQSRWTLFYNIRSWEHYVVACGKWLLMGLRHPCEDRWCDNTNKWVVDWRWHMDTAGFVKHDDIKVSPTGLGGEGP